MDEQDRMLRELLGHAPLADDGFSERVVRRVRRRVLIGRWLLPAAGIAGALIAAQPAIGLLSGLVATLSSAADALPAAQGLGALASGLALAAVTVISVRLLED